MFAQEVEPIEVLWTNGERRKELTIVQFDESEPEFLSKTELIENGVEPDFEFADYRSILDGVVDDDLDTDFFERFFSDDDTYGHHTYKNSKDHSALVLERGDATLTISALKLMSEGIGLLDHDNQIKVMSAVGGCFCLINQVWIGGDAFSNLIIDFESNTPRFVKLDIEGWIDGVAAIAGRMLVLRLVDEDPIMLGLPSFTPLMHVDDLMLARAEKILGGVPRVWHDGDF